MSRAPVTALVTGATGSLGPTLLEALFEEGWRVRILSRQHGSASAFSRLVKTVVGDIASPPAVAQAMAGVDIVFHLAALLHIFNPSPKLRADYERVNVDGTRVVMEGAREAGVGRVVFFSTVAVYGATSGMVVDEETPPKPDSIYAETKLRAEQIALSARRRDADAPLATVLRMAGAYGPRMKGNYRRLARTLAKGQFLPIGDGTNRRTLIHERDAAAAALLAARHPLAAGHTYNVTDGQVHSMREILHAICAGLGRQPPARHLPADWVRPGVKLVDSLLGVGGRHVAAEATLSKFLEDVAASGEKFQRELGFRPRYDLVSGWRQTVSDMKRRGQL